LKFKLLNIHGIDKELFIGCIRLNSPENLPA